MCEKSVFRKKDFNELSKILKQSTGLDFQTINLKDEKSIQKVFKNPTDKIQKELIELIKAYQRLIRIIPEDHRDSAILLLKENILSATQIASMVKSNFLKICHDKCFISEELAEIIYKNAMTKRSNIVIQFMDRYQNNEPHIQSSKFK